MKKLLALGMAAALLAGCNDLGAKSGKTCLVTEKDKYSYALGANFGSLVMLVLPDADWGSSYNVLALMCSSFIPGSTSTSMNRLINVDFPVLTGPTTPI